MGGVETAFTRLVGCEHPLQQAAMGGVATPELAGAVAKAGAVGMLCEYGPEPAAERMARALDLAGAGRAVGMGFFAQWIESDLDNFEVAANWMRVVELFWSEPDPKLVARARGAGSALVGWQIGSLDEAMAAEDAGCDYVIAQGLEAGGHVRGLTARDALLAAVLERVSVPVVAAGGIATAADVAAIIDTGASGVRVGTRFVATEESSAHPTYIQALVAASSGEETVLTTTFSGGWPDAPHRVLRSAVDAADAYDGEVVGHVFQDGERRPIPRYAAATPSRDVEGDIVAMALYAGQGVGAITDVRTAADVVSELVSGLG
jgi:NAD(P)H-dependent flavin oxidoreductase YrpB (nitropropane dioxygenase family)